MISNEGALIGLVDAEKDAEDISETIKMQMDPIPRAATQSSPISSTVLT